MKHTALMVFASLTLLISACGGGSNSGGNNGEGVNDEDSDIKPITEGDWYRPSVMATWQIQLQGKLNTSYDAEIYVLDLFDTDTSVISELQATGKKVICYFSAGSYEDFREDKDRFLFEDLGKVLENFSNENWLDIRSENVFEIMQSRMDRAVEKGCDGVDPDNVNGYINDTGFDLTADDQLVFNKRLANEAHKRNLSVSLKNDLSQVEELIDYFDFSVNEQCFAFNECERLLPFVENGKPVLNIEYLDKFVTDKTERERLCSQSVDNQFSTLILPFLLDDDFRHSCL